MPIIIHQDLPAYDVLTEENIFVMNDTRACEQDIRPLSIVVVNLMPTKVATETQLLRLLSNSPLQIDVTLLATSSYQPKNTPQEHLESFYKTFPDIKNEKFDGMIITGAPVEQLPFEDVEYWDELIEIMEFTKHNVYSTLHICWGAQAGLYYHYGIPKYPLEKKLSGVYAHWSNRQTNNLLRGFDSKFYAPHSRWTEVRREDIEKVDELEILAESNEAGVYIVKNGHGRHIFITGHAEYDTDTLKYEYERDIAAGMKIDVPENYFPADDPSKDPQVLWRAHANLLYYNWLNYYVYQETPFDLTEIS